jgi:hypothetical protein
MRHPEVVLAPALMVLNYYLTLLGADLARQSYRRHFLTAHYELNPVWQKAVDRRRWFNLRHLALAMLIGGMLVLLTEAVDLDIVLLEGLLGFVFTYYGLSLGRHLSNILTFAHLVRCPDEVAGEVRLSHSYVLSLSIYQLLVVAVPIAMIAVFSPSPFALGAVAAVLATMLVQTFWLSRARRSDAQQPIIRSGG